MIPKTSPIPTATSPYSAPSATASISCWSSVIAPHPCPEWPGPGPDPGQAPDLSRRGSARSREVGGGEPLRVESLARADRQAQLAVREHVRAVGEGRGERGALLDEQDRDPALADLPQRTEDGLDDRR